MDWSNFENYYKRVAKRVWIYFFLFNQWLHRGISVILPFVWTAIFPNAFTLLWCTLAFRRRPQKAKLTNLKSRGHKSKLVVDKLTSHKSTATSSKSGILEHSIPSTLRKCALRQTRQSKLYVELTFLQTQCGFVTQHLQHVRLIFIHNSYSRLKLAINTYLTDRVITKSNEFSLICPIRELSSSEEVGCDGYDFLHQRFQVRYCRSRLFFHLCKFEGEIYEWVVRLRFISLSFTGNINLKHTFPWCLPWL